MKTHPHRLAQIARLLLPVLILSACQGAIPAPTETVALSTEAAPLPTDTPLPTATDTITPVPPTQTSTLEPTFTPSVADTETPSPSQTSTIPPTSGFIPLPYARDDEVKIYFILPDPTPGGCNDRIIAVSSGAKITGNIAKDVAAGLRKLFTYRNDHYGDLYNALHAGKFRVEDVDFDKGGGLIDVMLSGSYRRSPDPCENARVKAQVWTTIRQFPEIKQTNIFLGRIPFGDLVTIG